MIVPVPLLIVTVVIGVALVALTVTSLGAWYGIYCQREDERRRLIAGEWVCDRCGTTMRFARSTIENDL